MDQPLRNVRTNIVQSIRAFTVKELETAAEQLGHHFLYANLATAQSKQDVLDLIARIAQRDFEGPEVVLASGARVFALVVSDHLLEYLRAFLPHGAARPEDAEVVDEPG